MQQTIALSSTEAEYLALLTAAQEAIWLRNLCIELQIQAEKPILIMCDNKGALDLSKDHHFSPRTKHINLRQHFIKQKIEGKIIKLEYLPSSKMLADILTKVSTKIRIKETIKDYGLL